MTCLSTNENTYSASVKRGAKENKLLRTFGSSFRKLRLISSQGVDCKAKCTDPVAGNWRHSLFGF